MFKFLKKDKVIGFMKYHKLFFSISLLIIFVSFISFFVNKLNFGIDFTGGLLFDITVDDNSQIASVRNILLKNNFNDFNVQSYGKNGFIIRISEQEISKKAERELSQSESIQLVKNILAPLFDEEIVYNKIDFVGPQVGGELIKKAVLALFLSCIVMLVYIAFRFEWNFGIGVIISLIHDSIIVLGIYSLFKIDFDLTSIAAILTIIGYSVNDTVVIYDKIRELISKHGGKITSDTLNTALTITLRRTLLTSSTTLVSLLILAFFGGDVLKYFSLIVFLGIVIGTYSSIFISTPILLYIGAKQTKK